MKHKDLFKGRAIVCWRESRDPEEPTYVSCLVIYDEHYYDKVRMPYDPRTGEVGAIRVIDRGKYPIEEYRIVDLLAAFHNALVAQYQGLWSDEQYVDSGLRKALEDLLESSPELAPELRKMFKEQIIED